jgi:hypothetical protein
MQKVTYIQASSLNRYKDLVGHYEFDEAMYVVGWSRNSEPVIKI